MSAVVVGGAEPSTPIPLRRPARTLLPAHRALLADARGIGEAEIAARGYFTATKKVELGAIGFKGQQRDRVPALVIPLYAPDGRLAGYQMRPDAPYLDPQTNHPRKYETPAKARPVLDVPPVCQSAIRDVQAPLFITEGSLKADALATISLAALAVAGVDGWRRNAGWDDVWLKGRTVYLTFDSDVTVKASVYRALRDLTNYLRGKGAVVSVIYLPNLPGGAKCGVDDFLVWQRREGVTAHDELHRALFTHAEDDLREPPAGSTAPTDGPRLVAESYTMTETGLFHQRPARDGNGSTDERLTNFAAVIARELVDDDGAVQQHGYDLAVKHGGRDYRVTVPVERFTAFDWPRQQIAPTASVLPGQSRREHAAYAIPLLSEVQHAGPIPRVTRYGHTGWREIDGQPTYLSAAGGIGPDGLRADVEVNLSGSLAHVRLPVPPEGEALRAAVRASLALADVAEDAVSLPLLGAVYRAPLGPCDVSLFLVGRTQRGKSTLADLMTQHWGAMVREPNRLASWHDTPNALESLLYQAKDMLGLVDDYRTDGDVRRALYQAGQADRILRGQANQQGRARLTADLKLRPARAPRGLALVTGEDVPPGHSLRARLLIVPVGAGAVRWDAVTPAQAVGDAGTYAEAMAGYVHWLVQQGGPDALNVPARVAARRATERERRHRSRGEAARADGNAATILVGWDCWLTFAQSLGAVTPAETEALLARAEHALADLAAEQEAQARDADPTERFLTALADLFAGGQAHVRDIRTGDVPLNATRWGWKVDVSTREGDGDSLSTTRVTRPGGTGIGFVDEDAERLYLLPAAAHGAVSRFLSASGLGLGVGEKQLGKLLAEAGRLDQADRRDGRNTARVSVVGARYKVWALPYRAELGQSGQSGQSSSDEHDPRTAPPAVARFPGPILVDPPAESGQEIGPDRPDEVCVTHDAGAAGPIGPIGPIPQTDNGPVLRDSAAAESPAPAPEPAVVCAGCGRPTLDQCRTADGQPLCQDCFQLRLAGYAAVAL